MSIIHASQARTQEYPDASHPTPTYAPDGIGQRRRRPRALRRHPPRLHPGGRRAPVRLASASATRWPRWAPPGCGTCCRREPYRADAGRADRQPGGAAGQGRAEGDLPVRLAGRGRRQHRGRDVSGPVAVSGRFGAERGAPDQRRAAPLRPDRAVRGRRGRYLLDGADRRRRGSRLRRRAERLRADEGDDRRRRRRRAFRGPARVRKEVRPSGRQGAGADRAAHPHAERRAPGGRRRGRAHRAAVPHRRAVGAVADHRRR